ncbi:MAG: arsenate reductase (thioredoxin) [candidate division Zixibacteria bacterium RBG_16_50_21]|nr:MAG: arsenate reductase (thioredoxin) [candidate division Zixibacteria bacterium RBG_16_50_21]
MKKIMFVCTGNSARSQMAEGWAKILSRGKWEVYSAGLEPKGVNPKAIRVMQEVGINISNQKSKSIDYKLMKEMDVIVTLCDNAKESCPVTPPHIKTFHWSLPDPAAATGSEEKVGQVFRLVRDEIKSRMEKLLSLKA